MAKTVKEAAVKPAATKGKAKAVAATSKEVAPIVLTPEQYEAEFQKKIKSEIQKYSLPDKAIAELKKKYTGLTVKDVNDKEGIKALKDALTTVRGTRTGIEDKRVELKADYIRIGKSIDGEAKRLTELIVEIEQPLKDEKERIDKLEKEEKERKEKEEAEKLDSRVATLKEAGMIFDGNFYSIANMSMDVVTLKQMKDFDFEVLVAKVKIEAKRIEEEKAEQKRIEEEKAEKDRLEREEFEQKQKDLQAQEDKMRQEREEFQRKQDEFAEQQRKAQQEEEDRKAAILKELVSTRTDLLESLGFSFLPSAKEFVFQNKGGKYSIAEATLSTASPEYWKGLITGASEEIKNFNIKQDEIIAAENEQLRKDTIAEEQRKQKEEQEAKERQEEEERLAREKKEQEDREAEEARLAALPDVEKVLQYVRDLKSVAVPSVTNEEMGATLIAITEMLDEMEKITVEELEAVKKPAGE